MTPGKRYQVFSIREYVEENQKKSVWVKAGSAWVNRDGSVNVYLDVLPMDGKLHVREALEDRTGRTAQANGSPAPTNNTNEAMTMGAH